MEKDKLFEVPENVPTLFKKEGLYHRLVEISICGTGMVKKGSKVGVGVYGLSYENGGQFVGYVVVNLRLRLNRFENDKPYISFPSSEKWGVDGFSYYNLRGGLVKYEELVGQLAFKI